MQKVMAAAGVASRRASEKLISAGRVQVNGEVITSLGTKVDPASAKILVDGRPISVSQENVYYKVYKPRDVLSDIGGDARGRRTVAELLPPDVGRVFPVGRLDLNSEGLVLLTDDGELAHKLTHPRFEHPKTYYVLVEQRPPVEALLRLREGIELETGRTAPAQVEIAERLPARLMLDKGYQKGVWLRIVLREGKKRQIRHMISAVELRLHRLIRWSIGPLTLDNLLPGQARPLTPGEITALRQFVGQPKRGGRSRRNPGRRGGRHSQRNDKGRNAPAQSRLNRQRSPGRTSGKKR